MVIFTEPSMVPFMSNLRQHAINRTVFVVARNSTKNLQIDWNKNRDSLATVTNISMDVLSAASSADEENDAHHGYWSLPIRHIYSHLDESTASFARRHLSRLAPIELRATSNSTSNLFWHYQIALDSEYKIHQGSPLFWIWLSKTWMVNQVISLMKQREGAASLFPNAKFFFYSDIGSFRHSTYKNVTLLRHPEAVPANRLLWMAHSDPDPPKLVAWQHANVEADGLEDDKKIDDVLWNAKAEPNFFHSGSHSAGTVLAWQRFHSRFLRVIDRFVKAGGLFIGEDQVLLQQTCLAFPELCAYVKADDVEGTVYFGLRYVLYHGRGNNSTLWYPSGAASS
jgi:hypothetical protein